MRDWLGRVVDRDDLTRHDKWCCMMLPRLKLLRELLREDGAIFVSIDDNEVHHLRSLMDEVFGRRTSWRASYGRRCMPRRAARSTSRRTTTSWSCTRSERESFKRNLLPRTKEADARYGNPDDDPRGPWKSSDLSARNPYSKGTYCDSTCPGGRVIRAASRQLLAVLGRSSGSWTETTGSGGVADENQVPAIKRFLSEVQPGLVPETIWTYKEVNHTQGAKKTLLQIFPEELPGFTTKPFELIQRMVLLSTDPDSIILDSFAGSGTTAHAVLAQNREDGGNRRFILVECEDYADTVTAERVRRVIKGVPTARDDALKAGLGGTFSYFELGRPMRQESLLDGSHLPSWEKLAGYIFFTATGQEFDPAETDGDTRFVGRTESHDVFLFYEPDIDKLKDLALSLDMARALPAGSRRKLVFAPTKYLDREFLHKYRIDFQQLPFQIYEAIERLER